MTRYRDNGTVNLVRYALPSSPAGCIRDPPAALCFSSLAAFLLFRTPRCCVLTAENRDYKTGAVKHYEDRITRTLSVSCQWTLTTGRPALRGLDTRNTYEETLQRTIGALPIWAAGGAMARPPCSQGRPSQLFESRRGTQAPDTGNHTSSFATYCSSNTLTGDQPGEQVPARNSATADLENHSHPSQGLPHWPGG